MKGRNIGRGVSIWLAHICAEAELHDDVDAFNAPSECHALVSRGEIGRRRLARRHIKATTGLPFRVFRREVATRTSDRVRHFTCHL